MIFTENPEKCGPGPPPRPQPAPNRRGFWDLGSAPLPGARALGPGATGIRPRADGNPAPSRRKSGPEPTEIRPRADGNPAPTPIPSPPLKILTLLTSRSGGTRGVPPSLQIDQNYVVIWELPRNFPGITTLFSELPRNVA